MKILKYKNPIQKANLPGRIEFGVWHNCHKSPFLVLLFLLDAADCHDTNDTFEQFERSKKTKNSLLRRAETHRQHTAHRIDHLLIFRAFIDLDLFII